jgi:hypothetical protein
MVFRVGPLMHREDSHTRTVTPFSFISQITVSPPTNASSYSKQKSIKYYLKQNSFNSLRTRAVVVLIGLGPRWPPVRPQSTATNLAVEWVSVLRPEIGRGPATISRIRQNSFNSLRTRAVLIGLGPRWPPVRPQSTATNLAVEWVSVFRPEIGWGPRCGLQPPSHHLTISLIRQVEANTSHIFTCS